MLPNSVLLLEWRFDEGEVLGPPFFHKDYDSYTGAQGILCWRFWCR